MSPHDRLRWGVLTHVSSGDTPSQAIRNAVALAVQAEKLGFDSIWIAQHRFGEHHGYCPAPLVLLAAIAAKTTRISIGTAAISAGLSTAQSIAEDAAVLDAISAGRLQLGFGSGSSPQASAVGGISHENRQSAMWNSVDDTIRSVQTGFDLAGEPLRLEPHPVGLTDRMWIATGSQGGIEETARRKLHLIAGRRNVGPAGPRAEDERVAALIRQFLERSERCPRIALSRPIVAFPDQGLCDRFRRLHGLDPHVAPVLTGTTEEIAESLASDPGIPLATEILVHTRPLVVLGQDVGDRFSLT